MDDKNSKIADSIRQTREKRKSQDCNTYRFKIDMSSLSRQQLDSWKTDLNSKKIQHSALGRIKSVLMSRPDTVILDQWFPTTKMCSKCGTKNQSLTLSDRTFQCPVCGALEDRDIHAAQNMLFFYSRYKDGLGTSRTSKPANHRKIRCPLGSC